MLIGHILRSIKRPHKVNRGYTKSSLEACPAVFAARSHLLMNNSPLLLFDVKQFFRLIGFVVRARVRDSLDEKCIAMGTFAAAAINYVRRNPKKGQRGRRERQASR